MRTKVFYRMFQKFQIDNKSETRPKNSWLSVGLKMIIGVGLISNFCIGLLVYVNFTAFSQVGARTNALLEVNSSMNHNLRLKIFDLQEKYLKIPKLLRVDAAENKIFDWIRKNHTVEKNELVKGRDNYKKFFTRSQRRDISKGCFIVHHKNGSIIVSKGMMDKEGIFSNIVSRIQLKSENPETDAGKIKEFIETAAQKADNQASLKQKVIILKSMLADEAIAAESSRNAILYKIDDMENQKKALVQYWKEKQNTIGLMAVLAIIINLVMLYFMAWFVVETPLKNLTLAIEKINKGKNVIIPFLTRKDRIGVLAGSLEDFQATLDNLRKEDQRKKRERKMIEELIRKMSEMIGCLRQKANTMKENAVELDSLASHTQAQTAKAGDSVSKTIKQTNTVSHATRQLQSEVKDISVQVLKQNELVGDINHVTQALREDINELTKASGKINDIVDIVKNITGEIKLLALNARIEAVRSHACEKGFIVVAQEFRELSIQSQASNEDIERKIAFIQKVSNTIIEKTQGVEIRIKRLMDTSIQISGAVEEQSTVTTRIARNAHATANEIKDVAAGILKVKKAAQSTNRFAHDVRFLSEEIACELSTLLAETKERLSFVGMSEVFADFTAPNICKACPSSSSGPGHEKFPIQYHSLEKRLN